jgi:GAF domain-containing protein
VTPERRLHLLGRLLGPDSPDGPILGTDRLCAVCADTTATNGASIALIHDGTSRGSLCASDPTSELLDDLQFTLGEGPGIDACRDGLPVAEPDLADPASPRWVAFTPPAVAAGARAVFGFPIRIGEVVLGALHLYRDRVGPLTDDQHADALVLADMAAELILLMQAGASPGELASELERGASLHAVVHQASGMVSVQLGTSVDHALVRLRAHAFRTSTPLVDVARRVVERALRFGPDGEVVTDERDHGA